MSKLENKKPKLGKNEGITRIRDKALSEMSPRERTTYANKKRLYEALRKSFHIQDACTAAGIGRSTYNRYLDTDPKFYELVMELKEGQIDDVESALTKRIQNEDTTAIIFYLKTRGKDRGYAQPKEIINHNQNWNADMSDNEYDMSKLKPDEMVQFHNLLKKMENGKE